MFIYPKIKHKSQLYLRYIDDIFLLWTATEVELKVFIEEINKVHPQIKFDINYSYKQINFLDTTVTIENNSLVTSIHKTHGQACIPTSKILPSKINKKRDSIQSSSTDEANMQQGRRL